MRLAVQRRGTFCCPHPLGTSHCLIAPAHTLTLPSMEAVKDRLFRFTGLGPGAGPAAAMVKRGLLDRRHLQGLDLLRRCWSEH